MISVWLKEGPELLSKQSISANANKVSGPMLLYTVILIVNILVTLVLQGHRDGHCNLVRI